MDLSDLDELADVLVKYRRFEGHVGGRLLTYSPVQTQALRLNLKLLSESAAKLEVRLQSVQLGIRQ